MPAFRSFRWKSGCRRIVAFCLPVAPSVSLQLLQFPTSHLPILGFLPPPPSFLLTSLCFHCPLLFFLLAASGIPCLPAVCMRQSAWPRHSSSSDAVALQRDEGSVPHCCSLTASLPRSLGSLTSNTAANSVHITYGDGVVS